MSTERLDLGPVPFDESCAQVGEPNYEDRAHAECRAYAHQLERVFRTEFKKSPGDLGIKISAKGNAHDFGTYYEVYASFERQATDETFEAAYWLESNTPAHWDEEAKRELGL